MSQRASRIIDLETPAVRPAGQHDRWGEWLEQVCGECGVTVNGARPEDPQIYNPGLARRVFTEGSTGLGEAFMDGWWDCEALDELATRALCANIDQKIENKARLLFEIAKVRIFNFQKKSRAFQVGERHYDTGNDLFEVMLDPTMS